MVDCSQFPLLNRVQYPADVRRLELSQLPDLCDELRRFIIASVAETGGHLGASLGVVELTVALHYVFDTPNDRLVWDVGHQSYPHKIITGRRNQMDQLRKHQGLSGFNKRDESEYDTFGVGHSSTSISAALGMAIAARQCGESRKCVAIIGDGAMGAGMAYEALNSAGHWDADILVILNNNDMSISPNVGAMSRYLTRLLSSHLYLQARDVSKALLKHLPRVKSFAGRWEEHTKGMLMPGTLFEELGMNYHGPANGHDVCTLVAILQNLKTVSGPLLLHVVTQKGHGYPPAEKDALALHAVEPFDIATGKAVAKPSTSTGTKYTQVFSDWLCDMAEQDPALVAITPAMREGSGLVEFERRFAARYFDVGIAEQHAVTLAAGMACDGLKPVVAIYSTFLQRGYDQLIHDVAIQKLPVLFALDRAGLVGPDGPTHAGSFDFSYMRCLPGMLIMAPSDEAECRKMLSTGFLHDGPAAVRYPRGEGPGASIADDLAPLEIGQARVVCQGEQVALLAFGTVLHACMAAAEKRGATLVDMRFVKPLDEACILSLAQSHRVLVTVEENAIPGGAGVGVHELLSARGCRIPVLHIGLPDRFLGQGSRQELLAEGHLDQAGIEQQLSTLLEQLSRDEISAV